MKEFFILFTRSFNSSPIHFSTDKKEILLSQFVLSTGSRGMVVEPCRHQRSKRRGQDSCWKIYDPAQSFSSSPTLCMSYVIAMFLLASCKNTRNHLSYFARFCARSTPQNSEQKHIAKNFAGLQNHFTLITMMIQLLSDIFIIQISIFFHKHLSSCHKWKFLIFLPDTSS